MVLKRVYIKNKQEFLHFLQQLRRNRKQKTKFCVAIVLFTIFLLILNYFFQDKIPSQLSSWNEESCYIYNESTKKEVSIICWFFYTLYPTFLFIYCAASLCCILQLFAMHIGEPLTRMCSKDYNIYEDKSNDS